jgi:enoyl-CoA hydratase/carnithine racemase
MKFLQYQKLYPNIIMERENGILDVRLHTAGDSLKWGITEGSIHDQLGEAFYRIGRDLENRVMILRGSGENYCTERNLDEYRDTSSAEAVYRITREGRDILNNMLEVEIPIISLVHGPVTLHPEIPLLADVVLASPEASFKDSHIPAGLVPGDGSQIFWTAVLGPTRASYFLLTEQVLAVEEALRLGVVHEVLPRGQLLSRAREIADRLVTKPQYTLRYTRMVVHQSLRERMARELASGFTAEFVAMGGSGGHPSSSR